MRVGKRKLKVKKPPREAMDGQQFQAVLGELGKVHTGSKVDTGRAPTARERRFGQDQYALFSTAMMAGRPAGLRALLRCAGEDVNLAAGDPAGAGLEDGGRAAVTVDLGAPAGRQSAARAQGEGDVVAAERLRLPGRRRRPADRGSPAIATP